ncbi:MAG: hypothetical protein KGL10_06735 [Alphaproteobacteria bacterium]|nr:hypothetical protein [Alphaproteobacteria bacterium]MDE2336989.1 hypothetical protein [Alphaproteobacteria bacterium]
MQACAKHSLDKVRDVFYVENKIRPVPRARRNIKLAALLSVPSAALLAKEIMCCSLATD